MRIVHLIARLNDGGPARVLAEWCRESMRFGHEVRIVCGHCAEDEPDIGPQLIAAGLRVDYLPELGRRPLSPTGSQIPAGNHALSAQISARYPAHPHGKGWHTRWALRSLSQSTLPPAIMAMSSTATGHGIFRRRSPGLNVWWPDGGTAIV